MKKPRPREKTTTRNDMESESETDDGPNTRSKEKLKQVADLPYKKVGSLKPVEETAPVPVRHMRDQKQASYKHRADIEEGVDIASVLDRILKAGIPLTYKEIMSLCPQLLKANKDQIVKKRIEVKSTNAIAVESDSENTTSVRSGGRLVQVATLAAPEKSVETQLDPEGRPYLTWKVTDPILQYLESLPQQERSSQVFSTDKTVLIAATDIAPLQVVATLVNDTREEEALLDSGSQIIAMSREAAIDARVVWDPEITINMQSANGEISSTCGLASNVPVSLGDITVYLQIHIVDDPPYRLLLGRPFDILTESRVVNASEGAQMIVITDPNTKQRANLPTYSRGELPYVKNINF